MTLTPTDLLQDWSKNPLPTNVGFVPLGINPNGSEQAPYKSNPQYSLYGPINEPPSETSSALTPGNTGALQEAPLDLPAFLKCEQIFPKWLEARRVISSALPNVIQFVITGPDSIAIDWTNLDSLQASTPAMYYDNMRNLLAHVHSFITIPMYMFEAQFREPLSFTSLTECNRILLSLEGQKEFRKQVTIVQTVRHLMGIVASPLHPESSFYENNPQWS